MRPILFFSAKKFDLFPEVPFSKALGYDITLPQFRAMIVRANTDPAKVKMLANDLQTIARDPEFVAYLEQQMGDPNSFVGEAEAERFMKSWLDEARALAAAAPK